MSSAYEAQRAANIKANEELLRSLGLDVLKSAFVPPVAKPAAPKPKPAAKPKPTKPKKRKQADLSETESSADEIAAKVVKDDSGKRRSARQASKKTEQYRKKNEESDEEYDGREERVGNRLGVRKHNPKTFGSIPGVEVGAWWEMRSECSTAAIHAPFVAGIAGHQTLGAYSVALSGGYDDDVDMGYGFTYTGCGGRDLKGTKQQPKNLRTAPQSSDQTFDNPMNAALLASSKTRKPVRVIRGFKLRSPYAPKTGYRYDGLYVVEKAWMEKGLNPQGYKVCKYAFKRLPDQPPIPERNLEAEEAGEEEEEEEAPTDGETNANATPPAESGTSAVEE